MTMVSRTGRSSSHMNRLRDFLSPKRTAKVILPPLDAGTTTPQAAAVAAYFLPLGPVVHNIAVGLMLAAVVVTVVTGVMYLVDSFRVSPAAKA